MTDHATREAAATSALCRHHWVIETPNGALSHGRCKRCGTAREFRNSSEEALWDNDSFSLNGSRYRGRRGASES
ncbi:MAG: hypothetical protein AMXMBFR80_11280 [Dehalococcoidia bacterium]|jgi:hypothetical protein|nr:hypothetical protein [Tepidiformaceae bacterium]